MITKTGFLKKKIRESHVKASNTRLIENGKQV
jgi:hypothetical protein